jgi:hypothetical protein
MHRSSHQILAVLVGAASISACVAKEDKPTTVEQKSEATAQPLPEPTRSKMAINPETAYTIVSVPSGKCVQFAGASVTEPAPAEISACNGAKGQQFKLSPVAGGYYKIANVSSSKCLDVVGVSVEDGAVIQQYPCNDGPNQHWIIADASPGSVRLVARHSGRVVDVQGGGTADGTPLTQYGWHNAENQQFKLVAVGGPAEPTGAGVKPGTDGAGGAPGKAAKGKKKPGKAETKPAETAK